MAAPTAAPTKPISEIGVSDTRSGPNSANKSAGCAQTNDLFEGVADSNHLFAGNASAAYEEMLQVEPLLDVILLTGSAAFGSTSTLPFTQARTVHRNMEVRKYTKERTRTETLVCVTAKTPASLGYREIRIGRIVN